MRGPRVVPGPPDNLNGRVAVIPPLPPTETKWSVKVEFKLQDMWVGVFWDRTDQHVHFAPGNRDGKCERHLLDVWVCILPCLPLHIRRDVREPGRFDCTNYGRHRGPFEEVKPWSDVDRCMHCGWECGK